jgi:Formin Homology 2 Domain
MSDIVPDVTAVADATRQVRTSKLLPELFELILQLGNFVNGGTFRGNAYGFRVECLLTLTDTRSMTRARYTLMHYLVDLIGKSKRPELLDIVDELETVAIAQRVSMETAEKELGQLGAELKKMHEWMPHITECGHGDRAPAVLGEWIAKADAQYDGEQRRLSECRKNFAALLAFLGEEDSTKPEQFFSVLHRFLSELSRAIQQNKDQKAKEERLAERKRREEERSQATGARRAAARDDSAAATGSSPSGSSGGDAAAAGDEGVLDNIFASIQAGQFSGRRDRRDRRAERRAQTAALASSSTADDEVASILARTESEAASSAAQSRRQRRSARRETQS